MTPRKTQSLTRRETQILYGMAAGLTLHEVADRLNVSVHTARHFKKSAGFKLGTHHVVSILRAPVAEKLLPTHILDIPARRLLDEVKASGPVREKR